MKPRSIVLLFVLVVLAGLALLVWLTGDPGEKPPSSAAASATDSAEVPEPAHVPERQEPEAGRRIPAEEPAAPTGSADAIELDGNLVFPPGTPADEKIEVVLSAPEDSDDDSPLSFFAGWREVDRGAVAADGSFHLNLPGEASKARVGIEARYLFLPRTVSIENPAEPSPLCLEPELGGVLLLRFLASSGSAYDARDIVGKELQVQHLPRRGAFSGSPPTIRTAIGDDLTVELVALDPADDFEVDGDLPPFAPPRHHGIRVRPGERTEVDIELVDGLVIGGQVVDEAGDPLAGAKIRFTCPYESERRSGTRYRHEECDAEGRFLVTGVSPSMSVITFSLDGYLGAKLTAEKLGTAEEQQDLRIVLGGGRSIEGIVRLDDERPVTGADVRCRLASLDSRYYRGTKVVTDDAGRFRFTGLGASDYTLDAEARLDDGALAIEHAVVQALPRGAAGVEWTATPVTTAAGMETQELLLVAPPGLEGIVVNSTGAPVSEFRLEAEVDRGRGRGPFSDRIFSAGHGKNFRSADGRFHWDELGIGKWRVGVEADGFISPPPVHVELPGDGKPVRFVVEVSASIAGIVRAPSGQPVAGARVSPALVAGRGRIMNGNLGQTTDEEGRFHLTGLTGGKNELTARADGLAPSEPVVIELGAGESVSEVELRLTAGGYLSIDVLGAGGAPEPYAVVILSGEVRSWGNRGETDTQGHLELGPLFAGEYQVNAQGEGEGKKRLRGSATVVDGETTRLMLGGERRAAAVVGGLVTSGGKPVAGALVHARPTEHEHADETTETGADGRFSLGLVGGGRVLFQVYGAGRGRFQFFEETIPEQGTSEVVFDLPSGGLRGSITREDGGKLSFWLQVVVERQREKGTAWAGGDLSIVRVEENGSWSCLHLAPGRYRVVAAGDPRFSGSDETPAAPAVIEDIIVKAGRVTEGIDLVLGPSGTIEGTVRGPDGRPIAEAMLRVRDLRGRPFHPSGPGVGPGGSYSLGGLPARQVSVEAFADHLATPIPLQVEVKPGEVVRQDLQLVPATVVTLELDGWQGTASGVIVRLRDHEGREYAGERGHSAGWLHAANRTERSFGPLPPGRWLAGALLPDGRDVEVTFELAGERELTFVLNCE
jgi:hypothetical protein